MAVDRHEVQSTAEDDLCWPLANTRPAVAVVEGGFLVANSCPVVELTAADCPVVGLTAADSQAVLTVVERLAVMADEQNSVGERDDG